MKLLPMRVLVATAPSGGEIRFIKYDDRYDRELSYYHGILDADEDRLWWKAKLAAERAGAEHWARAVALFTAAGWTVREENTLT
jgi:hypothetical protein